MATIMNQVNCKTLGTRNVRKYYATGSGAMDHFLVPDGLCQLLEVQLHLDVAPVTVEDFVVNNDNGIGDVYDIDLLREDLSSDSTTDLIFKPEEEGLSDEGDVLRFKYTNTDGRTWGLIAYIEYL